MIKKKDNLKNLIKEGENLSSKNLKFSSLVEEFEIFGYIPIKKNEVKDYLFTKNGPRHDSFNVYCNCIVSDNISMPYYKKIEYCKKTIEYNAKLVYTPEFDYQSIKKCLFRLNTQKCLPYFQFHNKADEYVRDFIKNSIVTFKTETGSTEKYDKPFDFGNNHEAFYTILKDSFIMFESENSDQISCVCYDFQVLCRYINSVTGNLSFVILNPSDIYVQ